MVVTAGLVPIGANWENRCWGGGVGKDSSYQFCETTPWPEGLRTFFRRLCVVTLGREERRLRFWSSRPIFFLGVLYFGGPASSERERMGLVVAYIVGSISRSSLARFQASAFRDAAQNFWGAVECVGDKDFLVERGLSTVVPILEGLHGNKRTRHNQMYEN